VRASQNLLQVIDNMIRFSNERLDIVREMQPHIERLMINKEEIKNLLAEITTEYTKGELIDAEVVKKLDEFREILVKCSSKFTDYGSCIYINVKSVEGIGGINDIDKNYRLTDNEAKLLADTLKVTTGSVRRIFLSAMIKDVRMYEVLKQLSNDKDLFKMVEEDFTEAEKNR